MSKSAVIAFAVPAIGALLGTLGAEPSHPAPDVAGATRHVIGTGGAAALRYWTAERMRHARAAPGPRPRPRSASERPGTGTATAVPVSPAGPGREARPGQPAEPAGPIGGTETTGTAAGPMAVTAMRQPDGGAVLGARWAAPHTAWAARGAVLATTGKVFFTVHGGDFVCSAGTITAANRDLVVTAGHCAQDFTGAWAQNWIYVPGYDQGRRPYGGFAARQVFVPTAWAGRRDENYDVAMVALAPSGGRHVADVVGAQSIAFEPVRGSVVYGFGYPVGGRYDGERLTYCQGRIHPDAHRLTNDRGLRCDMAEGASGGPWLARFDTTTGTGVVVSVNSFKYADDPGTMYGPYFGPAIRRLYEEAQRA